jgi:alpha-tubulin suppressor-like RCC1 family protein
MRFPILRTLAVFGAAALISCGDGGVTTPDPLAPTYLEAVGATEFDVAVGGQQPVRVRVLDQNRAPMANVPVQFTVTGGEGSAPASVTTDAEGYAQVTWSFGTVAGAQTLTATGQGLPAVIFSAQVRPGPATGIQMVTDTLHMSVLGATTQMSATVVDAYGNPVPGASVTWSTGDPLVAQVDETGLVTATGRGTTTVRASYGSLRQTAVVRVTPEAVSVTVSPDDVLFEALLRTRTLDADVRDAGGTRITDAQVTWESGNTEVATVDAAGRVTARGPGETWVAAHSGGASDTARVVVHQTVDRVRIVPDSIMLEVGAHRTLTATLRDPDGHPIEDGRPIIWTTTDGTVVTVDEHGTLQGQAAGEALVRATVDGVSNTSPVMVFDVIYATQITAGGYHSCALATNGRAYCWGSGSVGRLGTGSSTTQPSPAPVAGNHVFTWIGAGISHTCALRQDGAVFCWGTNTWGQLGTGEGFSAVSPVRVGTHTYTALSVSDYHTCAVRDDGGIWCWGLNIAGMSGAPEDHDVCGVYDDPCVRVPFRAAPGMAFTDVAAHRFHSCGLTAAGEVYCWGSNLYGQLGDGTAGDRDHEPRRVQGDGFTRLSGGGGFHTCALKTGGAAYCWGLDHMWQLGNNMASPHQCSGEACSRVPMAVAGGRAFSHIATSYAQTCGAVPGDDAYCWGWNWQYALGDGTDINRAVPTRVINASFKDVDPGMIIHNSVGRSAGCGIDQDGRPWCWGVNMEGQVGDGTILPSTDPARTQPVRVNPFPYRAPLGVEAQAPSEDLRPASPRETVERPTLR